MLIRATGHHDGVQEYLEEGQKLGREHTRDELDERVVLAGDLDLTNAVIQAIDASSKVERYLSITLSFKEDHVDRETLFQIARDFEAFALHAYRPDEYSFYAEAHLPRIKSYVDKSTGELVERKPHIHIVIPKHNLISGQALRPFGFEKHNLHFIDAFQEHTNARYGLASPKDNRRTLLTDASEMISRYRGNLFRTNSRELKEQILDAVLDRQIESQADFMALLHEHGAVRIRNAGRDDAYPNVKPAGADKGVNLKEYVFTPEFITLPTAEKLQALSADAADRYEAGVAKRRTPDAIAAVLDEWYTTRSRELKYLNSGSRQYQQYQESSPHDRQLMLADLERGFYAQHLKAHHDRSDDTIPGLEQHLRGSGSVFEFGAQPSDAVDEFDEREIDLDATQWQSGWELGWEIEDVPEFGLDGYDELGGQLDFVAIAPPSSAQSVDDLHGLPGRRVGELGGRSAVLLPDHALHELEPDVAVPADRLRWLADCDGKPSAQRVGGQTPGELAGYHRSLDALYAFGDPFESLPSMRPPVARAPAAMSPPGWFEGRERDPFLDRFDVVGSAFDFDGTGQSSLRPPEKPDRQGYAATPGDRQPSDDPLAGLEAWLREDARAYEFAYGSLFVRGAEPFDTAEEFDECGIDLAAYAWQCGWEHDDAPGRVIDRFDAIDSAFDFDVASPALRRPPAMPTDVPPHGERRSRRSRAGDDAFVTPRHTGRASDNVVCQLARQVRERRNASRQHDEFREIRQGLDARRLLAELSYTHGLRPAKYVVVTGRDGTERIRAGKRALNVSDFLTKELNLSWREAAPMLREIYQRQQAGEPIPSPRELPRAALWREYSVARESHIAARSAAWLAQRASEQLRRGEIRTAFEARRDALKRDVRLASAGRRAAISLARAERLGLEDALRQSIARERAALKEQYGAASGPTFSDWLRTRAEAGDERALEELRRTARPAPADVDTNHSAADEVFSVIRPKSAWPNADGEDNQIIFRSSGLSWSVDERGNVTYRQNGRDVVRDRGAIVQVLQIDRSAIEAGLRLAQSKFGHTLELAGNEAHQLAAAKVAVDAGLRVQFSDARLNRAMNEYRHTCVGQHVRDVLGRHSGSPRPGTLPSLPSQGDRPEQGQRLEQPRPSDDNKPTV